MPAADEPGSIAVFNRAADGALNQPGTPNGCIDDARDQVQPSSTCTHRTGLLNPYRVNVSPDSKNVYVGTLNVFPPAGLAGPGPGELSQFNADLTQLDPPCLQQVGLPAGGLEPTAGCALNSLRADPALRRRLLARRQRRLRHLAVPQRRLLRPQRDTGALTQDPPEGRLLDRPAQPAAGHRGPRPGLPERGPAQRADLDRDQPRRQVRLRHLGRLPDRQPELRAGAGRRGDRERQRDHDPRTDPACAASPSPASAAPGTADLQRLRGDDLRRRAGQEADQDRGDRQERRDRRHRGR